MKTKRVNSCLTHIAVKKKKKKKKKRERLKKKGKKFLENETTRKFQIPG